MAFVLDTGERGKVTLLETDGQIVAFEAPFAAPPGSTLSGVLDGTTYKVKVRGSKRLPTGDGEPVRFRIEGKFFDLTKTMRDRVLAER
jgi:hypothetical protein